MNLPDTADIALLPNLGPKSARALRAAGVRTIGQLRATGPADAYLRARTEEPGVSLNLLWALVAGLRGEDWRAVTDTEKRALREQVNA